MSGKFGSRAEPSPTAKGAGLPKLESSRGVRIIPTGKGPAIGGVGSVSGFPSRAPRAADYMDHETGASKDLGRLAAPVAKGSIAKLNQSLTLKSAVSGSAVLRDEDDEFGDVPPASSSDVAQQRQRQQPLSLVPTKNGGGASTSRVSSAAAASAGSTFSFKFIACVILDGTPSMKAEKIIMANLKVELASSATLLEIVCGSTSINKNRITLGDLFHKSGVDILIYKHYGLMLMTLDGESSGISGLFPPRHSGKGRKFPVALVFAQRKAAELLHHLQHEKVFAPRAPASAQQSETINSFECDDPALRSILSPPPQTMTTDIRSLCRQFLNRGEFKSGSTVDASKQLPPRSGPSPIVPTKTYGSSGTQKAPPSRPQGVINIVDSTDDWSSTRKAPVRLGASTARVTRQGSAAKPSSVPLFRYPLNVEEERLAKEREAAPIEVDDDEVIEILDEAPAPPPKPVVTHTAHVSTPGVDRRPTFLITSGDLGTLKPGVYLNDAIIDFWMAVLRIRGPNLSAERARFLFLSSFFYKKMRNCDTAFLRSRGKEGDIVRDAVLHSSVARWTKKFDVFKHDTIFSPVNFAEHWSLICIVNAPALAEWLEKADAAIRAVTKVPRAGGAADLLAQAADDADSDVQEDGDGDGDDDIDAAAAADQAQAAQGDAEMTGAEVDGGESSQAGGLKLEGPEEVASAADDSWVPPPIRPDSQISQESRQDATTVKAVDFEEFVGAPASCSASNGTLQMQGSAAADVPMEISQAGPDADLANPMSSASAAVDAKGFAEFVVVPTDCSMSFDVPQQQGSAAADAPMEVPLVVGPPPRASPPPAAASASSVSDYFHLLPPFPSGSELQPFIYSFDSISGYHRHNPNLFRKWIVAEWCARRNGGQPVGGVEGSLSAAAISKIIPFSNVKAPQQNNSCDCGVFLLRYIESIMRVRGGESSGGASSSSSAARSPWERVTAENGKQISCPDSFSQDDIALQRIFMQAFIRRCKASEEDRASLSIDRDVTAAESRAGDAAMVNIYNEALASYLASCADEGGGVMVPGILSIRAVESTSTRGGPAPQETSDVECIAHVPSDAPIASKRKRRAMSDDED